MALIVATTTLLLSCMVSIVHAAYSFQEKCSHFKPEARFYNCTRHLVAYVAAGTNLTLWDNDPSCNRTSQAVAVNLCRVALSIRTSDRSNTSMELWLPEDWSGRFLATGNGGIDGCRLRTSDLLTIMVQRRLTARTLVQVSNTKILHTLPKTALPLLAQTMVTMVRRPLQCITTSTSSQILLGDRMVPL